jgi:hypothetical protein
MGKGEGRCQRWEQDFGTGANRRQIVNVRSLPISSQLAPLRGPIPRTVVAFANTCAIIASFSVWDILDMSGACCAIVPGGCHAK